MNNIPPDIPVLRRIEEVYGVTYNQIIFLPLDFGLTETDKQIQKEETRNEQPTNSKHQPN